MHLPKEGGAHQTWDGSPQWCWYFENSSGSVASLTEFGQHKGRRTGTVGATVSFRGTAVETVGEARELGAQKTGQLAHSGLLARQSTDRPKLVQSGRRATSADVNDIVSIHRAQNMVWLSKPMYHHPESMEES
jgi:hypothetical protein